VNKPDGLLLDEMFSPAIAGELTARGADCRAVVADPLLRALSDLEIFETALLEDRVIVTNNVPDFESLRRARGGWRTGPRLHLHVRPHLPPDQGLRVAPGHRAGGSRRRPCDRQPRRRAVAPSAARPPSISFRLSYHIPISNTAAGMMLLEPVG
jgi:hypothetical protein